MINGTFEHFWELIREGCEAILIYNNHEFLVQGWYLPEEKAHFFCVEDLSIRSETPFIWTSKSQSMEENARKFLDAKIFFGKSFREIEDIVEWSGEL